MPRAVALEWVSWDAVAATVLWVTAYAVLLGAELNAGIEHQTARATTTGRCNTIVAYTFGASADRA